MRKQSTLLAVLSTAAFMLAVTPAFQTPAYASNKGWVEEDGNWRFYDSDGDFVSDSWKKSGSDWYYLTDEGFRALNTQIDEYYVGEDGKRVSNKWITEENEAYGSEFDEPEFFYHFFDQYGKEVEAKWKNIDGNWYYFNEDGCMLTGKQEVDGATYYFGDDGARKTGWFELENTEEEETEESQSWQYFEKDGIMVLTEVDKKIDGQYYTFIDGKLQTGWVKLPNTEEATASEAEKAIAISDYQYYEEDGKRAEGWHTIEGIENINDDGELFTFYFKKGAPYYAETGIQVFSIDSKQYGFNTKGEMQKGLEEVTLANGNTANFYFDEEGVAQTGKQIIYSEDAGIDQTWLFITSGSRKGQGTDGINDGVIYFKGLRQDADEDLLFAPVTFAEKTYLVNKSGKIQKASASSKSDAKPELGKGFKDFTDENDQVWTVDRDGIIQK